MKRIAVAILYAALAFTSAPAFADADDAKWVAQCVSDNKDEKAAIEVITKYCTCMNGKMSDDEKRSVTQWEKTHETERTACEKQSGWK